MEPARDPGARSGAAKLLDALVGLQQIDQERDEHQARIDQVPRLLAARRQRIDSATATLGQAEDELKHARAAAHEREVDLRANADNIRKAELQLNTAKTNQEYQALSQQIARLKQAASAEEDETLELYERIEKAEAKIAERKRDLATATAEFEEFQAVCQRDQETARQDLSATDERRQSFAGQLPRELISTYERLRQARDGRAVVSAQGRICSGCGINLKPNDIARLLSCREIVACDSCQRILFLPEALAAQASS